LIQENKEPHTHKKKMGRLCKIFGIILFLVARVEQHSICRTAHAQGNTWNSKEKRKGNTLYVLRRLYRKGTRYIERENALQIGNTLYRKGRSIEREHALYQSERSLSIELHRKGKNYLKKEPNRKRTGST
jgi:hypothetical protein